MKEVIIDSGIPCYEIEDYFKKEATLLHRGKYVGAQWQVAVNQLEDQGCEPPTTKVVGF